MVITTVHCVLLSLLICHHLYFDNNSSCNGLSCLFFCRKTDSKKTLMASGGFSYSAEAANKHLMFDRKKGEQARNVFRLSQLTVVATARKSLYIVVSAKLEWAKAQSYDNPTLEILWMSIGCVGVHPPCFSRVRLAYRSLRSDIDLEVSTKKRRALGRFAPI